MSSTSSPQGHLELSDKCDKNLCWFKLLAKFLSWQWNMLYLIVPKAKYGGGTGISDRICFIQNMLDIKNSKKQPDIPLKEFLFWFSKAPDLPTREEEEHLNQELLDNVDFGQLNEGINTYISQEEILCCIKKLKNN